MPGTLAPVSTIHRTRGLVRTDVSITTDASGNATEQVVGVGYGALVGVLYNGGLDASANITIRDHRTGAVYVSYTTGTEGTPVAFRPTTAVVTNAGAAITPAATAPNVNRDAYVAGKVSVSVSSGGNAETCVISLLVDESGIAPQALS
jgi:hypothetical protein